MAAFDHLCVVEYGSGVAAPFCGRLFADLGARVIKVEPPSGDPSRQFGPFPDDMPDNESSGLFHLVNAGKESVVADLDKPSDLAMFHRLLEGADVLIEGATGPERERWGLDFAALAERHPHLVAVSISAYGRTGPWANRPGVDLTVQAVSSLPDAIGSPDRRPLPLPYDQADYQAGFHAAAAALCALYDRTKSGLGQGVDISAAHVLSYLVGGMYLYMEKRGTPWKRTGTNHVKGTPYPTGFFEVLDGFVCISTMRDQEWHKWIDLMGNPVWAQDAGNRDSFALGKTEENHSVDAAFKTWLKEISRQQIIELGRANGLILEAANTIDELLKNRQFAFRDCWGHVNIGGKDVRIPKPGYLFSETPVSILSSGPALGGNGAEVRANPPARKIVEKREGRSGALAGIRVLDFGWNWAAPLAAQLLADMGAEVIRIETTLRPDQMRTLPFASYFFCHANRSKKSATFNVADPRGAELVRKLAAKCDIVLDNFAAGVMRKNGLGYQDLVKSNPRIIVVSMSLAGQEGPERNLRGYGLTSSVYAGLETLVGYPEDDRTTGFAAFALGDTTQGIQGAMGALTALLHRERTGQGQFVDMGQIMSLSAALGEPIIDYQLNGRLPRLRGGGHSVYFPHEIFPCDDGARWMALAVRHQDDWQALCRVMGRKDWAQNEAFNSLDGRRQCAEEIDSAIREWCKGRNRDQMVEALCASGIPAAPVLELSERNAHAVFAGQPIVAEHKAASFDPCSIYETPWHLTATPPVISRPAPAIGEHNDYVFRELLGLNSNTIEKLKEEKVLI